MQGFLYGSWLISNYFHSFLKFTMDRSSIKSIVSHRLGYNFSYTLVIKNYHISLDLAVKWYYRFIAWTIKTRASLQKWGQLYFSMPTKNEMLVEIKILAVLLFLLLINDHVVCWSWQLFTWIHVFYSWSPYPYNGLFHYQYLHNILYTLLFRGFVTFYFFT